MLANNTGATFSLFGTTFGTGNIINNGLLTLDGQSITLNTNETLKVGTGGTVTLGGASAGALNVLGGGLYLDGTINSNNGGLNVTSGNFFLGGGTINRSDPGDVDIFGLELGSLATPINAGNFPIPTGQTLAIPDSSMLNVVTGGTLDINNENIQSDGTLKTDGGTIELRGTISNGHTSGKTGVFNITSGTVNLYSGCNINKGSGTSTGSIFGASIAGLTNPISSSEFTIPSGQTMTIPNGSFFHLYGTSKINNSGELEIENAALLQMHDAGTEIRNGFSGNVGTITLPAGSALTMNNGNFYNGRTANGIMNISGGGCSVLGGTFYNGFAGTGSINIGNGSFYNSGTLEISSIGGVAIISGGLTNNNVY